MSHKIFLLAVIAGICVLCHDNALSLIKSANLVGAWRFEGNANDWSGNNNNGTVTGATLATGKFGQCYSFDGVNDYISKASHTIGSPANGTLTAWVKVTDINLGRTQCNSHNGSADCQLVMFTDDWGFAFSITDDGSINLDLGNGTSWLVTDTTPGSLISNGIWYFIAISLEGTTVKYYVDGVLQDTNTVATNNGLYEGSNIRLGIGGTAVVPQLGIYGLVDEPRIFNRALTSAEIRQLMLNYDPGEF